MRYLPEPAGFLDASESIVIAGDRSLLVAAAFTASSAAPERTLDTDDLGVSIEFLHSYRIRVTRSAAKTTGTASVFERMEHLVVTYKILEFSLGFAPKNLLKPSPTRLAHVEHVQT